jgi:DNA-binding CsgD family transcriptional regulator
MLTGRTSERAALDQLLDRARRGRSGSLTLRGPPGTGKSALLSYARTSAAEMTVLHASGVPAESDLPFAVLHQLVRPVTDRLRLLPSLQRDALDGALALGPPTGADRFLVSAAVLTLLAEAADTVPLLCVLDDVHWMDRSSLDALMFAVRRLDADRVATLFAIRSGEEQGELRGSVDTVDLSGLPRDDSAMLVAECAGVSAADDVMTTLMAATGGNPLALTELARMLETAQLLGRMPLPDPLPVSAGMEEAFLEGARALPGPTQQLLVVAAAEGTGDLATVLAAAERLGITHDALGAAELAQLVAVDDSTLSFRHPSVRSAIYGGADGPQRRAAHAAVADALIGAGRLDRRVWHRAAAAVGLDDAVADELVQYARRATLRSGHAAAAAALRRSAALTSDRSARARRLIDSAEEAWLAGKPDMTSSCLDEARLDTSDPALEGEIARMRARFELRQGTATDAFDLFIDAALTTHDRDPDAALSILAEAAEAALYVGDVAGIVAAGQLAGEIPARDDEEGGFWRDVCLGNAEVLQGRIDLAEPLLRRRIADASTSTRPEKLVAAGVAAVWLGDQPTAMTLYDRAARAARVADMTGNLPYVLEYLAAAERTRGRYATSRAVSEEGLRLSQETGQETSACTHLSNLAHLAALTGDEQTCYRYADEALARALPRRLGLPAARAALAIAVLHLGAGRFAEALQHFTALAESGPGVGHPAVTMFSLADRIEAAVHVGDLAAAHAALDALQMWHRRASADARAITLRCRALLANGEEPSDLYMRAIAEHVRGASPAPEQARTELAYGEWLRRTRRPAESRVHLRAALAIFDRLGARPWAQRARLELNATGETTQRRTGDSVVRLTPQEIRIARAVVAGHSTKEIAAQLFLSPRTVEYHLHKAFPKLGISSRIDLVLIVTRDPSVVEE